MATVSAIIVNYNKRARLVDCIESVLGQDYRDLEITVVDNGSRDGSSAAVRELFGDQLTLIESPENLGGSGGFNLGLRRALERGPDYLMLLDNDVVLPPHTVKTLVARMEKNPGEPLGALGPVSLYMAQPNRIWCGGGVYRGWLLETTHRGGNAPVNSFGLSEGPVDYMPACCLLIGRENLERAGLMDERFFVYNDDVDLGLRLNRMGLVNLVVPGVKILHDVSYKRRSLTPFIAYYSVRNHLLLFFLYASPVQRLCLPLLLPVFIMRREALFILGSLESGLNHFLGLNRAMLRALKDFASRRFGRCDDL